MYADCSFAFDLNKAIPYHSLTDDERKRYWDDGLHLTPAGYDWMGGHVGDALVEIIRRQDPQ
jgi:lysophospholipase L1-like esterase